MTAPSTAPAPPATDDDPDLHHVTCCDDDISICGMDVSGENWCDGSTCGGRPCVPCRIAEDAGLPCPVPGCTAKPRFLT